MKLFRILFCAIWLVVGNFAIGDAALGGMPMPAWFKISFLDFREDLQEALAHKRGVMLFVWMEGCPYCAKMLEKTFQDPEVIDATTRRFDAIGINIFGAQEVTWVDGHKMTEKQLSQQIKAQITPTIIFINREGKITHRFVGYRTSSDFVRELGKADN